MLISELPRMKGIALLGVSETFRVSLTLVVLWHDLLAPICVHRLWLGKAAIAGFISGTLWLLLRYQCMMRNLDAFSGCV